jgi:hypothetical protein
MLSSLVLLKMASALMAEGNPRSISIARGLGGGAALDPVQGTMVKTDQIVEALKCTFSSQALKASITSGRPADPTDVLKVLASHAMIASYSSELRLQFHRWNQIHGF